MPLPSWSWHLTIGAGTKEIIDMNKVHVDKIKEEQKMGDVFTKLENLDDAGIGSQWVDLDTGMIFIVQRVTIDLDGISVQGRCK